jgi:hypothetical protein
MRLFFLTIPKPPCPLVPYVAGGSDSIRFNKKLSIPLYEGIWGKNSLTPQIAKRPFHSSNKIVQRFYETPAPLKAGRDLINERLKFLSAQHRRRDFRFTPTSSGEFKFKVIFYGNESER